VKFVYFQFTEMGTIYGCHCYLSDVSWLGECFYLAVFIHLRNIILCQIIFVFIFNSCFLLEGYISFTPCGIITLGKTNST